MNKHKADDIANIVFPEYSGQANDRNQLKTADLPHINA